MDYRKIIRDSWVFTHTQKRVVLWLAFIPSLLWILVGIAYVMYQYLSFARSPFFAETPRKGFWEEFFDIAKDLLMGGGTIGVGLLITAITIVVLYLLLPTLFDAALIQYISRIKHGQTVRIRDALTYGLFRYLPLFEYHTIIKTFSFIALLTETSFIIRNLGPNVLRIFLPVFIVIGLIGLLLTLLFIYTDFYIVIDGKKMFASIGASCGLVLRHLQYTLLMTILMLLIGVRIIVNIIFVLAIPSIILVSAGYFATVTFPNLGYAIGGLIGTIALFFASRLSASIHVFANTVWTYTFLELTSLTELSPREGPVTASPSAPA